MFPSASISLTPEPPRRSLGATARRASHSSFIWEFSSFTFLRTSNTLLPPSPSIEPYSPVMRVSGAPFFSPPAGDMSTVMPSKTSTNFFAESHVHFFPSILNSGARTDMSESPDTNFLTGSTLADGLVMAAFNAPRAPSSKSSSLKLSTSMRVSLLYDAFSPKSSHSLAPVFSLKLGSSKFLTVPGSIVVMRWAQSAAANASAKAAAAGLAHVFGNGIFRGFQTFSKSSPTRPFPPRRASPASI